MGLNVTKCVKLVSVISFLASAYCHAGNGWTGYGNIAEFGCHSDNDAVVARCAIAGFNGTADSNQINYCGKPWGTLYLPAEGAQNSKYLYSALLAAFSAGKKVRIYTNGCFEGYPLIGGIIVQN
ncbi:MAG TPA: hypothetical protein VIM59_18805 [Cellvibrio sp.]